MSLPVLVYPGAHGHFLAVFVEAYTGVWIAGTAGLIRARAQGRKYLPWIGRAAAVTLLLLVVCWCLQWLWEIRLHGPWSDVIGGAVIGVALLFGGYAAGRRYAVPEPEGQVTRGAVVLGGTQAERLIRQRARTYRGRSL